MNLVAEYAEYVGIEHRKRFAQFFTPPPIARFMVKWVLAGSSRPSVHDPAFGLGAFYENAPKGCCFSGMDVDCVVLDYYRAHNDVSDVRLLQSDYLLNFGAQYDNIVCNPPYLRFQKFLNRDVVFRAFKERLGVSLSGYTNIASAFLVKSISELKDDGRLAYIMPSEFLNSGYGTMIKEWLTRDGHLDSVIEVGCEREAFGEVTTSVCIVLYDKGKSHEAVSFRRIADLSELGDVMERHPLSSVPVPRLDCKDKWGNFFVSSENRVRPARGYLQKLSEYGKFTRGIATGANRFFVLSKSGVARESLHDDDCRKCITKSQQLKGNVFTDKDFSRLADADAPVYLFSPGGSPGAEALRYIEHGERQGFDKGFITRNRKPWYKMETRKVAPILLNVFSRAGYKVVRNYSSALSLTNFHCFYPNPFRSKYVDWLFLYLQSGVGRKILSLSKRKYGNSLDKFEPNDLNSALVPRCEFFDSLGADVLADLMGAVVAGEDVEERLNVIFAPLLSCRGAERESVPEIKYLPSRAVQLRLAIEKRKGYRGAGTAKSEAAKNDAAKTNAEAKVKRPKSVKSRYVKHGGKKLISTILAMCVASATATSAFAADARYFAADEMPDMVNCLPPPPAPESAEFAADVAGYRLGKERRKDPKTARRVLRDAEWTVEALCAAFDEAFGAKVRKGATPATWKVVENAILTTDAMRTAPKKHYARKRPFVHFGEPPMSPDDAQWSDEGSYPSGHTMRSWLAALILAEINPARADAIYARAWEFGEERVVAGAHWQSDVDATRPLASIAYSRLQTSPAFRADMEKAKLEFTSLIRRDNH